MNDGNRLIDRNLNQQTDFEIDRGISLELVVANFEIFLNNKYKLSAIWHRQIIENEFSLVHSHQFVVPFRILL